MKKYTLVIILCALVIVLMYGWWLIQNTGDYYDAENETYITSLPPAPPPVYPKEGGIPEEIKRSRETITQDPQPLPLMNGKSSIKKQTNIFYPPLPSDPTKSEFIESPTRAPHEEI